MEPAFSKRKLNLSLVLAKTISVIVLATTVFSLQLPAATAAPSGSASHTYSHFVDKVSGKLAWADWYIDEDTNGIYTTSYLLVSERTTHLGSNNNPAAVLEASVYQFRIEQICEVDENGEEYCYDEEIPVFSFFGCKALSKSEYFISRNLSTATLNTEVSGCEYYGDTSDSEQSLTIHATWTGYGETFKGRDRYMTSNNFERVTEYSVGSFKQANVEASFVGEGISLSLDESGIGEAHLSKSQDGYFERIRIDPN